MANQIPHSKVVLAGIVPNRRDRLLEAMTQLDAVHFSDDTHLGFWKLLNRYFDQTAGVLPKHVLTDILRRSKYPVSKTILYEELYDEIAGFNPPDHEWKYSVQTLKEIRSEALTGEAITNARQILEQGLEIDGKEHKGYADMWSYLYQEGSAIEQLQLVEVAPEGDIRSERDEMLQDYADRKSRPLETQGIQSGVAPIDRATSGYQPGELALVVAYTGEGKSQYVTQTAWHAAVKQGKNVFFATTETIRPMVRRRLLARHSREPQFGIPGGFNSKDLKRGTLPPEQEAVLPDVIEDLHGNEGYGKLYLAQVPRGASLKFLEGRLRRQQSEWNIDLVVIDYLALLRPDTNNNQYGRTAELSMMVAEAKQIAATFDNGRGVPLLSPWAIKVEKYHDAVRNGAYTLGVLSDTSEAEKSADQIMSFLTLPDMHNQVKVQFLKNRDGETPGAFLLETDFRSSYLGERREVSLVSNLMEI